MQDNMEPADISLDGQEGCFGVGTQKRRRKRNPSVRDQMQERREPLPFRGDTDDKAPPLAWTTVWKGTYSNLYGYYIDDEGGLKGWGYMFWDAQRLRDHGMIEVIERSRNEEWELQFNGKDPREIADGE